jgi:hypothetical protein
MSDLINTMQQALESISGDPLHSYVDNKNLTESLALTKRALRWGVTQEMRERMPHILWAMVNNELLPPKPRREAMKILAMIEAQNQKDEHIQITAKRNSMNLTINTAVAKVELTSPERAIEAAGLIDGKPNIPEPPVPSQVLEGEIVFNPEPDQPKPEVIDQPCVKDPSP